MKKEDLTMKGAAELQSQLAELQARLAQLRFDLADKKLKRTSEVQQTRRAVARIMTALQKAK